MRQQQLSVVTYSIIVLHILYALPPLGGFIGVELKNRSNSFFKRLKRFGYINCTITITITELIDRSDYELFRQVCSTSYYAPVAIGKGQ